MRAGVAFSEDGKARAGMGVDVADFENSGSSGLAITNFDNEMIALYRRLATGVFRRCEAWHPESARHPAIRSGFGCAFFDADLDGRLDLVAVNGHIDETVRNIALELRLRASRRTYS